MTRRPWRALLRERLWWFDVVYPVVLAGLLFTSLTFVVYAGMPQFRLSLAAEGKLRELSLRLAKGRSVRAPGVLVVSADHLDVGRFGRAPFGPVPDTTAASYARVIDRLAEAGIPSIFVHWDPAAHPEDETYYLPLIETATRIGKAASVSFVLPGDSFGKLPDALKQVIHVVSDEPCRDNDGPQIDCPYEPNYKDWIIQVVLGDLGQGSPESGRDEPWLSTELQSGLPSYMLDLSPPDELPHLHFRDLLSAKEPKTLGAYRMAFVGKDQGGSISGTGTSTVTRRVLTVYDPPGTNTEVAGTPLHVFVAQVAQMFLDRATIAVPPKWMIVASTVMFCIMIGAAMSTFGWPAALGAFLVATAAGPYVNAFAIRHLRLYLPLFDSYYFGLSTILAAGMGALSVSAFKRWRLEAQQKLHAHVADLKGNFISLLSHNLNTPVAKMQGMLGLLSAQPQAAACAPELKRAEALVTQLEYYIRCVLTTSALNEGATNETPRKAKAIIDEFVSATASSLRRLGLTVRTGGPHADEDEFLEVPLSFDVRALTAGCAAMAALFAQPDRLVDLDIDFTVSQDLQLIVAFSSPNGSLPNEAIARFERAASAVRHLDGVPFRVDVLAGLVCQLARTYRGTVEVVRDSEFRVALTLCPKG